MAAGTAALCCDHEGRGSEEEERNVEWMEGEREIVFLRGMGYLFTWKAAP